MASGDVISIQQFLDEINRVLFSSSLTQFNFLDFSRHDDSISHGFCGLTLQMIRELEHNSHYWDDAIISIDDWDTLSFTLIRSRPGSLPNKMNFIVTCDLCVRKWTVRTTWLPRGRVTMTGGCRPIYALFMLRSVCHAQMVTRHLVWTNSGPPASFSSFSLYLSCLSTSDPPPLVNHKPASLEASATFLFFPFVFDLYLYFSHTRVCLFLSFFLSGFVCLFLLVFLLIYRLTTLAWLRLFYMAVLFSLPATRQLLRLVTSSSLPSRW